MKFGQVVAHVTSDIFYINPYDGKYVWQPKNSEIVETMGSTAASKKVPSSFYQPLKVVGSMLLQGKTSKREAVNSIMLDSDADQEKEIMERSLQYDAEEAKRPFMDRLADWTKQMDNEDPRHVAAENLQQEALDELNDVLSDL